MHIRVKTIHTELDAEDVRPIARLDKHNLVLVAIVQRPARILLDREMENRRARLKDRIQVVVVAILRRDELRAPEAELGAAAPGDEDRRVVDADRDGLLGGQDKRFVPKGCRQLGETQERGVLRR